MDLFFPKYVHFHLAESTWLQIFKDGWEAFKARHPRYEGVDEVVQKMLGCGEFENGYAVYICPECFGKKKGPFSCKSLFCLSCAKMYTANWVETIKGMCIVQSRRHPERSGSSCPLKNKLNLDPVKKGQNGQKSGEIGPDEAKRRGDWAKKGLLRQGRMIRRQMEARRRGSLR